MALRATTLDEKCRSNSSVTPGVGQKGVHRRIQHGDCLKTNGLLDRKAPQAADVRHPFAQPN